MIIDGHSHVGKDYYFGGNTLEQYDEFCKENKIDIGLLMPMPWPMYELNQDEVCLLIWEHDNNCNITYYKLTKNKKLLIDSNPYQKINEYYYNKIINTKTNTKIYFVPLIHGVLDNALYIEQLIENTNPKAVKFHGFSSGFFKEDVNMEIVEVLKYYDIPVILHTSVYNYDDGYGIDTKYWRNKCSPKKWLDFLVENELKGVLNHGACLDEDVIKKVNKRDNIMIGLGPDLDISLDHYKVSIPKDIYFKEGYLNILKKITNVDKIIFDVDYNWNTNNNGDLDYDFKKRIESVFSDSECEKVFYKNALTFYKGL